MVPRPRKKTGEKKANFVLEAPSAGKVALAGDFNNWSDTQTKLRRNKKNNLWKKNLTLKPGRYEYKFVVDGNWINDPNNSNRIQNSFGTENSVIKI